MRIYVFIIFFFFEFLIKLLSSSKKITIYSIFYLKIIGQKHFFFINFPLHFFILFYLRKKSKDCKIMQKKKKTLKFSCKTISNNFP